MRAAKQMSKEDMEVLGQVIEEELELLTRDELIGCWRSLCAMILLRTANVLTGQVLPPKEQASARRDARAWLDGENAVVPFRVVAEELDLDPEWLRKKMLDHVQNSRGWPINKAGIARAVFGRNPWDLPKKSECCWSGVRPSTMSSP